MTCPFLKRGHARCCSISPFRKMLLSDLIAAGLEKCSRPGYQTCELFAAHPPLCDGACPATPSCPYLHDSLVQYCSANPTPKFIPYAESSVSRCSSDSHRYCELYLALVEPEVVSDKALIESAGGGDDVQRETWVGGIRMPGWLYYTSNHLWLDLTTEGYCHVGVDGFLAAVLGRVDNLTFLGNGGIRRPSVVVAANGSDLQLTFPNPFQVTYTNHYLRAHPDKVVSDPYTFGWLFEGLEIEIGEGSITRGLRRGSEAYEWMRSECDRLTDFVHRRLNTYEVEGLQLAQDGGTWARGLVHHMSHEDVLALCNEFFSPFVFNGGGRLGVAQ